MGVGLSQWGAKALSEQGQNFADIWPITTPELPCPDKKRAHLRRRQAL